MFFIEDGLNQSTQVLPTQVHGDAPADGTTGDSTQGDTKC